MRVIIQKVKEASVTVKGKITGEIASGYMLLVGITHTDTLKELEYVAEKIAHLRLFEDEEGKMNHSLLDVGGEVLSVSQFTLYADTTKGRRPSFAKASPGDHAEPLWNSFNELLRNKGLNVETGIFGEMMNVSLINDGPVTVIVESK
ncbi:D-aminoacyl-tRNA deacylase [Paenisporosarcina cavernae]|uniref:D-aminoacyl-tRNA deacylase n=1 Tax=Paenisporosarcina cavernae TaxID=2320858 RepID=A0A385YTS3_9BACL|nr:D-aminoacyl-tRNA deacylase [Paenisporosarcina cavernae]AYC29720.1 D-tyrosyl-tRNA(Tyr) deacylase [Paenisporosarcina cavernae]